MELKLAYGSARPLMLESLTVLINAPPPSVINQFIHIYHSIKNAQYEYALHSQYFYLNIVNNILTRNFHLK